MRGADSMKKSHGRPGANSVLRMGSVALAVVLQIAWLVVLNVRLNEYSQIIATATSLVSLVVVLKLYSGRTAADLKLPWIMLLLVFPVMGLTLYLLILMLGAPKATPKRLAKIRSAMPAAESRPIPEGMEWAKALVDGGSAVYDGTQTEYFPEAVDAFRKMKEDLAQAEKFIFMEYFIVEDGEAFRELEEILVCKAGEGVEVRLMYDDMGSAFVSGFSLLNRLNRAGINCRVFNPALPILNPFMNHRGLQSGRGVLWLHPSPRTLEGHGPAAGGPGCGGAHQNISGAVEPDHPAKRGRGAVSEHRSYLPQRRLGAAFRG